MGESLLKSQYFLLIEQNNNLNTILSCPICNQKVRKNRMCLKCSELFCESCINDLIAKGLKKCPICRKKIKLNDLKEIGIVKEIFEIIDKYPQDLSSESEKCMIHNMDLSYYCIDCKNAICSDCAIITSLHKGHQFDRIKNIYEMHQEVLKQESIHINQKIKILEKMVEGIDINLEKVMRAKEEEKEDINSMLDKMQMRLEIQLEENLHVINKVKEKIFDEINNLELIKDNLTSEINQASKIELINNTPFILKQIKNFNSEGFQDYSLPVMKEEFFSELIPEYVSGLFILANYKESIETKEIVYSDTITINGVI